jgi:hypothetical protein
MTVVRRERLAFDSFLFLIPIIVPPKIAAQQGKSIASRALLLAWTMGQMRARHLAIILHTSGRCESAGRDERVMGLPGKSAGQHGSAGKERRQHGSAGKERQSQQEQRGDGANRKPARERAIREVSRDERVSGGKERAVQRVRSSEKKLDARC